jgi:tRNA (mo5U34)-methyltransferase
LQRARNVETTEGFGRLIEKFGKLGWYHSIELPDGSVIPGLQTLAQLRERIARYPIPQDLRGKRVLDIGAWDGWFSFEMERRGATVVAVDSARQETFFEARRLLNSKVEYIVEDVCHLSPRDIGTFDIVLFFGVLYHLKHPLLALERVCELTRDLACVESLVIDDPPQPAAIPLLEFYENTELGGQFDNWCGPNTACLLAFLRTAGFVNPELIGVDDNRALAVAYRKWPSVRFPGDRVNDIERLEDVRSPDRQSSEQPDRQSPDAPTLVCVENLWTRDHTFRGDRDHYFTAWFDTAQAQGVAAGLDCDSVFLEVGPYACRPVGVRSIGGTGWQANCKLPPGLARGWFDVRLALKNGPWSNSARIPVDLSRSERRAGGTISEALEIAIVTDGKTYERNRVQLGAECSVSIWARGLPADAEKREATLRLDGTDLPAVYLSKPDEQGMVQINAMLPVSMEPGEYSIAVSLRGVESRAATLELYTA